MSDVVTWTVTSADREALVRDGFRGSLRSGLFAVFGGLMVLIVLAELAIGGWPLALVALVEVGVVSAVVLVLLRRRLARRLRANYPDWFVASGELVEGRLRLVGAISTVEIDVAHLRRPRVVGTAVTVLEPESRMRRVVLPLALLSDEAIAALSES